MDQTGIIAIAVFAGLVALWLIFYFIPVGLWFSALVSGVRISLLQLILMRWRKVPPSVIVSSMIESTKAGLSLDPNELEAHFLAGGNVPNVVHALVSAQKANIQLDFKMATAIDLAGRDVFEAVQMSVNPKVINTPPVAAVAKDGIQLIAKARVTVRANIKQLVGGAGEETVLARVICPLSSCFWRSFCRRTRNIQRSAVISCPSSRWYRICWSRLKYGVSRSFRCSWINCLLNTKPAGWRGQHSTVPSRRWPPSCPQYYPA